MSVHPVTLVRVPCNRLLELDLELEPELERLWRAGPRVEAAADFRVGYGRKEWSNVGWCGVMWGGVEWRGVEWRVRGRCGDLHPPPQLGKANTNNAWKTSLVHQCCG